MCLEEREKSGTLLNLSAVVLDLKGEKSMPIFYLLSLLNLFKNACCLDTCVGKKMAFCSNRGFGKL